MNYQSKASQKNSFLLFAIIAVVTIAAAIYYYSAHYQVTTFPEGKIADYDPSRDRNFIFKLFRDNWYWLVADDNYSVDYMLDNRASQQFGPVGDLTLKVYLVNEKPVGFLAYYMKSFYKGYVLFLAVDDAFRKKGYAEKLLRYALDELKKEGASIVQLITRTVNVRAQSLYKKVGMHEIWRDADFVRFEIAV